MDGRESVGQASHFMKKEEMEMNFGVRQHARCGKLILSIQFTCASLHLSSADIKGKLE